MLKWVKISFSEIAFLQGVQSINKNPCSDIKEYCCKLSYKGQIEHITDFRTSLVMLQI